MCYFVSVSNKVNSRQAFNSNRKKVLELCCHAAVQSLSDVYKNFVDYLLAKYKQTKYFETSEYKISRYYTLKALESQCGKVTQTFSTRIFPSYWQDKWMQLQREIVHVGVMSMNSRYELGFNHPSFTTYFVGKFFAEFWMGVGPGPMYDREFVEDVGVYFVVNVLSPTIVKKEQLELNFWKHTICKSVGYYLGWKNKCNFVCFKFLPVLQFMNSYYAKTQMQGTGITIFVEALQTTRPRFSLLRRVLSLLFNKMSECKNLLRKQIYIILLAITDQGLSALLRFVVLLIKALFDEGEIKTLMPLSDSQNENIPILLCWVAAKGFPEDASQIFKLFQGSNQNYLSQFCRTYPESFWTPLEVAIIRNDTDMVVYFHDKVSVSEERLFVSCLLGNA